MSHYAKVVDGVVTNVIVAEADFFRSFVDTSAGEWIQTSYNTRGGVHYDPETGEPSADQTKALRMNYAVIGGVYDKERDAFYTKSPFPSWTLDEETCFWMPPTPMPDDGQIYDWDEATTSWIEVTE